MPDNTTLYVQQDGSILPVIQMHPNHARNALALVLSNPEHASRQFMQPTFPSERNEIAHARAAGFRYAVQAYHLLPNPPGRGVLPGSVTEVPVRRFIGRRAEARRINQANKLAGLRSQLFKTSASGVLERVR